MIIGTDISLRVCKEEGYTMAKYDGRIPFTLDTEVEFFKYLPEYIREEMGLKGLGEKLWTRMTARELWEDYQSHKVGIQSFADYHVEDINEIKTYYDLLYLVDIVDAYIGILS